MKGFTLIELLVVIAIIALLLSIMLPAMALVKERGRNIVCQAHLHGLGLALLMYATENKEQFLHLPDAGTEFYSNGILWYDDQGKLMAPSRGDAYWGVHYMDYVETRKLFRCPSSKQPHWFFLNPKDALYAGYGQNKYMRLRRVDEIKGSKFILVQDHFEQLLDDNGDMLYIRSGEQWNIDQWRPGGASWGGQQYDNAISETYRHNRSSGEESGHTNTLWIDGSVTQMEESFGEDVQRRWYTGLKN